MTEWYHYKWFSPQSQGFQMDEACRWKASSLHAVSRHNRCGISILNWSTLNRFSSWPVLKTKQCTKQSQTTMLQPMTKVQQMTTLPNAVPMKRKAGVKAKVATKIKSTNPHQRANLKRPANLFHLEHIMIMGPLRLLFMLMVWSQLIYSH